MSAIRDFIDSQLLEPLKKYPTIMQDTMLEIIREKLETLYEYTVEFPEIVSPDKNRLDILKAITDQFLFTIREDADLQEQIDILSHILYVYRKRGSVDTIENMWRYYGGTLPKDVKIIIPSYNLFRYSISTFSGSHAFANDPEETGQGGYQRPGVYEVRLTNNTYPIPDLKQFMLKELVAAGNRIYFTNTLHMDLLNREDYSNAYPYIVRENTLLELQLEALLDHSSGLIWNSTHPLGESSDNLKWSGIMYIYLEVDLLKFIGNIQMNSYKSYEDYDISVSHIPSISSVRYSLLVNNHYEIQVNSLLYCTPANPINYIARYLYNSQGEIINTRYPGYYVLGESLLGEEII